ncbi:MAG TPA: PIG-L family deacetylase [Candidatus Lokiarchaeia archaeon]|nr:PIG-L family deacetylase [Candidatus Lokiarchaeia archaeon]
MQIQKILVFLAHPDDTDTYCANFLRALVDAGKDIYLCAFTRGEQGIGASRDQGKEAFRGARLGRIRTRELQRAAAFIGIQASHVSFLDIFDTTVPQNKHVAFQRARSTIKRIGPDLVVMPEFAHSYYRHPDHVYAGMIAFIAFKQWKGEGCPVIFYHSMRNNFYFPVKDKAFGKKAVSFHESQADFFYPFIYPAYANIEQVKNGLLHVQGFTRAEGFRISTTLKPQTPGLLARMVDRIFKLFTIKSTG